MFLVFETVNGPSAVMSATDQTANIRNATGYSEIAARISRMITPVEGASPTEVFSAAVAQAGVRLSSSAIRLY